LAAWLIMAFIHPNLLSAQELVANGGFEVNTGGWHETGNINQTFVISAAYARSGAAGAKLAASSSPGFIGQSIAVEPNQVYLLSLWLYSPDGSTPNDFNVSWDGITLFDQTNIPAIGWTNLQFTVESTRANVNLQFGFRNDHSSFGLDDVSVQPVAPADFSNLHSFTNTEGGDIGGVICANDGSTLFGAGTDGGAAGAGTVFRLNTDGSGFTILHNFTPPSGFPYYSNGDGTYPTSPLVLSGSTVYGVTQQGGALGSGHVFKMSANGGNPTAIHTFTTVPNSPPFYNNDGAFPNAGIILSGNTLYGTANEGGTAGSGTLIKVNTDGTGFVVLHSFSATPSFYPQTNSDGASPESALTLSGNTVYGTTYSGGPFGYGTIFSVHTDGSGFVNLHSFTGDVDGGHLFSSLVILGQVVYGTSFFGGDTNNGYLFKMNTDGTGFGIIHSFSQTAGNENANYDGANPEYGLTLSGNILYGTTSEGGSFGGGTVFRINSDGSDFTVLYNFPLRAVVRALSAGSDGGAAEGPLSISSGVLYGAASLGGFYNEGLIYAISAMGEPLVIWNDPDPITNGTPLSAAQLNASSTVPGSFTYSPPDGTILGVGTQILTAVFSPADTNYPIVTNTVDIEVLPIMPAVIWETPSPIRFPSMLTSEQLNATCNIPGTFIYNPPAGTVPQTGVDLLSVVFIPFDTTNYTSVTNTVDLEVDPKIAPNITWAAPSAIAFGTPLGPQQLNATADVSGSFAYAPPLGTVLTPGEKTLLAGFTPGDTYNYSSAGDFVTIEVLPPTPQQEFIYGHLLQITRNVNNFYDGFYTFINTITISNPTMSESRAGYVDLYDQSSLSGNEDAGQTAFPPIPAGGSMQITLTTRGSGQDNYFATVYEDGLYNGDSPQAEDSQEIFHLFSTTNGPSGGVPTGGGTLSAPGFSVPPQFTDLVISGPAFVNENSSAAFATTAYFNDGSTNGNLSPSWFSSLPEIVSGNFTAGSVTADTLVTISAQITLRGITKSASTTATVVKVQQPKLKFLSASQNSFHLDLTGTTGLRFELQMATNLGPGKIWSPIATNQILSNSATEFSDSGAGTNSRRFYRVRVLP
jgi:uncharacterized repeat protein (TIGR03803 family)